MPKRVSKSPYARERATKDTQGRQSGSDDKGTNGTLAPEAPVVSKELIQEVVRQVVPQILATVQNPKSAEVVTPGDGAGIEIMGNTIDIDIPDQIRSIGDGLGANIGSSLKQKILNGEFIDLGLLLAKPMSLGDSNKHVSVVDGQLVLQPRSVVPKLSDINQWTDAFLIYISIFTAIHPEATPGLLKYLSTIRLGASRFGGLGWKLYDEQFRLKKARESSTSWAVVDQELWLLYMNYTPAESSQGLLKPSKKCFDYNNIGWCSKSPCTYLHKCMRCSENHPSVRCNSNSNYSGAMFNFRAGGGAQQGSRFPSPVAGYAFRPSYRASVPIRGSTRGQSRYYNPRANTNTN